MSSEYLYPKSIKDFTEINVSKSEKGYIFEEFIYHHFKNKYDHVITTSKYDMGIDFICYNNGDLSNRIGIQCKNIKGAVTETNIAKMTSNHKTVYFCNKLLLITTGKLNKQAVSFCRNNEIDVIDKEGVSDIIMCLNKDSKSSNEVDYKSELIQVRKDIAEKFNIKKLFYIYTNKMIEDLIIKKPTTLDELLSIKGFGESKANDYGQLIIDVFK